MADRDPTAGRLAARLLLLHAYDPAAAALLGRAAELHTETVRILRAAQAQEVAGTVNLERVTATADETEKMLALVERLGQVSGKLRAERRANIEAIRRLVRRYELALGLRDPPAGKLHRLARVDPETGHRVEVVALEWVGEDGIRHVDPR